MNVMTSDEKVITFFFINFYKAELLEVYRQKSV